MCFTAYQTFQLSPLVVTRYFAYDLLFCRLQNLEFGVMGCQPHVLVIPSPVYFSLGMI